RHLERRVTLVLGMRRRDRQHHHGQGEKRQCCSSHHGFLSEPARSMQEQPGELADSRTSHKIKASPSPKGLRAVEESCPKHGNAPGLEGVQFITRIWPRRQAFVLAARGELLVL